MSKNKRKLVKEKEEAERKLRRIYKLVDDYMYEKRSARECIGRIAMIIYVFDGKYEDYLWDNGE